MLTQERVLPSNRRAEAAEERVELVFERAPRLEVRPGSNPSETLYGQLILLVIFALVVLMRFLR